MIELNNSALNLGTGGQLYFPDVFWGFEGDVFFGEKVTWKHSKDRLLTVYVSDRPVAYYEYENYMYFRVFVTEEEEK